MTCLRPMRKSLVGIFVLCSTATHHSADGLQGSTLGFGRSGSSTVTPGFFVRRSVYDTLGGFRPIPLMEDLEFVRRLERFGLTCCIQDPPLITSSRRFERQRPLGIVCGWVRLHVLFWLGASPDRLAEIYNRHAPPPDIAGARTGS